MCNKLVHAACVKINNNMISLFNSGENFKWYCDDCCDVIKNLQRSMDDVMKILVSLSAELKRTLDRSSSEKRITRQSKKNLPKDSDEDPPSTPVTVQSAHRHFHPVVPDVIVGTCSDVAESVKSVPDRKLVYASKFANSTSPDGLRTFLCTKLDVPIDAIDCRLLVSANQDVSKLNFVSFKIGVDPELFTKLLHPNIWPTGVLVREFISRPKNYNPVALAQ